MRSSMDGFADSTVNALNWLGELYIYIYICIFFIQFRKTIHFTTNNDQLSVYGGG